MTQSCKRFQACGIFHLPLRIANTEVEAPQVGTIFSIRNTFMCDNSVFVCAGRPSNTPMNSWLSRRVDFFFPRGFFKILFSLASGFTASNFNCVVISTRIKGQIKRDDEHDDDDDNYDDDNDDHGDNNYNDDNNDDDDNDDDHELLIMTF